MEIRLALIETPLLNKDYYYYYYYYKNIHRITAVLKVETEIITSIAASMIGRGAILVIMYVCQRFSKFIQLYLSLNVMCMDDNINILPLDEGVRVD